MSEEAIREYAGSKGFHPQTLERWLSWKRADGDALLGLACTLKLGENHVRDLLDWLEEIGLRDALPIHEILEKDSITNIQSDPRLGRGDRLKRIKERVRRLRFPRLSQLEDAIQTKIRELRLHPRIRLSVPPGLEGGSLRVEFSVSNHDELNSLVGKLGAAAKSQPMAEIFVLLKGEPEKEEPRAARRTSDLLS
jgi:hypothetical protein